LGDILSYLSGLVDDIVLSFGPVDVHCRYNENATWNHQLKNINAMYFDTCAHYYESQWPARDRSKVVGTQSLLYRSKVRYLNLFITVSRRNFLDSRCILFSWFFCAPIEKLVFHFIFSISCSKSTFWNYDGYNITTSCVRIFPRDSSEYLSLNAETLETALCSTATCEPAKCTKITPKTLYDLSSYVECTRAGNSTAGFQWAKIQYSSVSTPWPNVAQAQQRVFLGPNCTGSISSTSGFPTGVCIPNPVAERPGSALYGIATCAPHEVGATASLNPDCSDPYISSSTPITCWSSVRYFCAADLSLIVNWAALSANSIAEILPATFALASAQDLMSISVEVRILIFPQRFGLTPVCDRR
jgi:hypothetical protein